MTTSLSATLWPIPFSQPLAMNDSGLVCGLVEHRAFLWSPAFGTVDLMPPGATHSEATAINDAGVVVVLAEYDDRTVRSFRWTPNVPNGDTGAMQELATLLPGDAQVIARGINNSGQIAGYSASAMTPARPVVWDAGGNAHPLPVPGVPPAMAFAINDYGQVVGRNSADRVALWTPDVPNGTNFQVVELPPLFAGTWLHDRSLINKRGQVAGAASAANIGARHGFRWTPNVPNGTQGQLEELYLPGAVQVNWLTSNGVVLGTAHTSAGSHGFQYRSTPLDLNQKLPPGSTVQILGILTGNDKGRMIAAGAGDDWILQWDYVADEYLRAPSRPPIPRMPPGFPPVPATAAQGILPHPRPSMIAQPVGAASELT